MTAETDYAGQVFDLSLGEVYGLRTWRTDEYGRLRAVHLEMAAPWRPGINEAVCHAPSYGLAGMTISWGGVVLSAPASGRFTTAGVQCQCAACTAAGGDAGTGEPQEEPHAAPAESCKCGFYAYTSPATRETYSGQDGYVLGVIRGTGRTLIGTKGFRCQKAEIIALLDPSGGRDATLLGGWQRDRLRAVYPDVPMLGSRAELISFAPIESTDPDPASDDFWTLP